MKNHVISNMGLVRDNNLEYEKQISLTHEVNCCSPRIIYNPSANRFLAKFRYYYCDGVKYCVPCDFYYDSDFYLSPKSFHVSHDNIDKFFIVGKRGIKYPLFLEVPCGKCDICRFHKSLEFVSRCQMESQLYDTLPWFVTLTYSPKHLPEYGSLVKSDLQKFLKRFRINLSRSGYSFRFRYFACGEYGSTTERPHYHLILFGIPSHNLIQFRAINDILTSSWSLGFTQARCVNLSKDDKAMYYVAKYVRKQSCVGLSPDDNRIPPFTCASNRHGGIGAKFIDTLAPTFRNTLKSSVDYRCKWSNRIRTVCCSSYIFHRVFPSQCRSIPKVVRDSVYNLTACYHSMDLINRITHQHSYEKVVNLFTKTFKVLSPLVVPHCFRSLSISSLQHEFEQSWLRINHWLHKVGIGFVAECYKIDTLSSEFIYRLSKVPRSFDIIYNRQRAYDILNYKSKLTCYV